MNGMKKSGGRGQEVLCTKRIREKVVAGAVDLKKKGRRTMGRPPKIGVDVAKLTPNPRKKKTEGNGKEKKKKVENKKLSPDSKPAREKRNGGG